MASTAPEFTAIAGAGAAPLYGLEVIARGINNQRENFTRMVVVAREPMEFDPRIPCKTSILFATKHEKVFIDTSAYTVRRYPTELVDYMKSHGKEKVLFGTNFPMIPPAKALGGLEELGLSDEVVLEVCDPM